ncbi:hypothetical protein SBRCBS47491_008610 [Sporothrix bragantina]|uniref:Uncharacterized protein n=1 Tax=Sporothrix bragantina TaxID=671064 RepID=A0ABP0CN83_9PEZI
MAEASPSVPPEDNTPKAVKDRNCPYCGQAFTSSSLGRHLDLYIKERNPKRQDGIHNVEEIRRLRGGITRRNPKGSKRRSLATPSGTPSAVYRKDDASEASSNAPSPAVIREAAGSSAGTSAADIASMFPIGGVRWEATGVMNEVLVTSPDGSSGVDLGSGDGSRHVGDMDTRGFNPNRRPLPPRVVSRQAVRTQLDSKQKMQDALDDARAAELALREFTNAWRAAKQQIEMGSMPFDFDPLTMNFPALTLQCLRAQPTLFASTQLPTPASWSTSPPGASQYEALKGFFREEFRKWRVKCAAATTAQFDEIKYPPSPGFQLLDRREAVERAEQSANALEQEAGKHLEVAFNAWDELSDERKNELWVLELARGIATKQTEIDKLKEAQSSLRQEASSLKSQIEQLNRLQQPREFRLAPPAHIPIDERILFELQDAAVSQGSRGVGLNLNDRHSDLSTIVAKAIGRWKNVIVSSRASSTGMAAQRPLSTPTGAQATSGTPAAISLMTSSVAIDHPMAQQTPIVPTPAAAASAPAPATPAARPPKQARRNPRKTAQAPHARESTTTTSPPAPTALPQQATGPMPPPPTAQAFAPPASDIKPDIENTSSADEDNDDDEDQEDGNEESEQEDDEDEEIGDNAAPANQQTLTAAAGAVDSDMSRKADAGAEDDNDDDDDYDDEEEASDKDADAEMEDGDEFAHMHTPISRAVPAASEQPNKKSAAQLKIPRSRNPAQQIPRTTGASGIGLINASRSMPNINVPIHGGAAALGSDAMYMD